MNLKSHRHIFRSSAVVGSASIVNIILSIVKVKILAVLLGPGGIGLLGLYQNILGFTVNLAGCGLGSSGVRQVAIAQGDETLLTNVRRTLIVANAMLGLVTLTALWFFDKSISQLVFGIPDHSMEVRWIGIGVLLSLLASSQIALLQGMRRIGDLARITIFGAFVGALVGLAAVWLKGNDGVIWFVLVSPAASFFVAINYVNRLPRLCIAYDWLAIKEQWKSLLSLGFPIMVSALLVLGTQLAARSYILKEMGLESSGYFQASWGLSVTYIGLVLGAMSADYYPRLVAAIQDKSHAVKLVNEQTEVALLTAAPLLLAMMVLTPWIVELLYSKNFGPVVEILRWQVLGDVLKVASFPMSFLLLAQSNGKAYVMIELMWSVTYLAIFWMCVPGMGVAAAGLSFFSAYGVYFLMLYGYLRAGEGFSIYKRNITFLVVLLSALFMMLIMQIFAHEVFYVFGLSSSVVISVYAMLRLNSLLELKDYVKKRMNSIQGKSGVKAEA